MASKLFGIFCCVACVTSSVLSSVKVLQGPGSQTSLYGPDGSLLKAIAPGGTVRADPDAPAGLVASGPAILPSSPEIVIGGGLVGKIVTSYTFPGAAMVPAVLPKVAVAPLIPAIDGLEGQYIPGASEALFDDGSYREDIH